MYYRKEHKILINASKEIRVEVTADKTTCMVMPRDQNTERSHNLKTDNSYLKVWNTSSIWEQS
jgi:hypothetical protein